MLIGSLVTKLNKGLAANTTNTSFTAAQTLDTTTEPATTTAQTWIKFTEGEKTNSDLFVIPYGTNANNETMNIKVVGWNRLHPQTGGLTHWVSRTICIVAGTISSSLTGVAGQAVVATDLYCDTLSLTSGIAVIYSGTADVDKAFFVCDVGPYEGVTIIGDIGTCDNMNWLYGY